jgi:hypothetical protein
LYLAQVGGKQKKAKRGIETPRQELETIRRRLRRAEELHALATEAGKGRKR